MARKRKTRGAGAPSDPLAPYRRIRRPMPPPERIEEDRRRALAAEDAERQVAEALEEGERER